MTKSNKNIEIISSQNQLQLYGYRYYFDMFIKLLDKNELPHTMLFTGAKGIGKSTFSYHFVNYLLSSNEEKKYSLSNFTINSDNKSYRLICNNIHPNFFLLKNSLSDENIKIDQVRNLLNFLSKSTYSNNKKIVIIDNSEYLNLSSSNALLKALEEPDKNTYFFIIHNNSLKILKTIQSRCVKFMFFFSSLEKKKILKQIIKDYDLDFNTNNLPESFYLDTPGNLLKYISFFNDSNIDILNDKLSCILYLIEKYKSKKDIDLLTIISFFVEHYYNELSLENSKNISTYFNNKYNILKQIYDVKKFNLEKKNLFVSLRSILENEKR